MMNSEKCRLHTHQINTNMVVRVLLWLQTLLQLQKYGSRAATFPTTTPFNVISYCGIKELLLALRAAAIHTQLYSTSFFVVQHSKARCSTIDCAEAVPGHQVHQSTSRALRTQRDSTQLRCTLPSTETNQIPIRTGSTSRELPTRTSESHQATGEELGCSYCCGSRGRCQTSCS